MTRVYEGPRWTIDQFVSGFQNNAFLVTCTRTGHSVIIDTPDSPSELLAAARGTDVRAVLITHNHWDHLQGFDMVLEAFDVPVGIGAADAGALRDYGRLDMLDVSDGAVVTVGELELRCIATPGHTPGSTCFLSPPDAQGQGHLFTGDTLFPGGPGKTGSPEAFQQVVQSITSKLHTLPADTVVLPGHGAATTVGASKTEYEGFAARPHPPDLHGDILWSQ